MDTLWDEFEALLYGHTCAQLQALGEQRPEEIYYAFGFCCNAYYGEVLLSFNQEPDLTQYPWLGKSRDAIEDFRWNIGDWNYMDRTLVEPESQGQPLIEIGQRIEKTIWRESEKYEDDETAQLNAIDKIMAEFLRRACRVAFRLEENDKFAAIRREPCFTTFVCDHDETGLLSWARVIEHRLEYAPPWQGRTWPMTGRYLTMGRALLAIAAKLKQAGEPEKAAHVLSLALRYHPDYPGENTYEITGTSLRIPLSEHRAWALAFTLLAKYYQDLYGNRWDGYLNVLQHACEYDPTYAEPYYLRAETGPTSSGLEPSQALEELDCAIQQEPNDPRFHGLRGHLMARIHTPDFTRAIPDYSRAMELEPGNEKWISARANAYARLQRYEEAIADYSAVNELEGGSADRRARYALKRRAECYQALGKFDAALADIAAVEQQLSGKEAAQYRLVRAECFRAMGELEKAVEECTSARESLSDHDGRELLYLRAECNRDLEMYAAAIADCTQVLPLVPLCDIAKVRLLRAECHRALGQEAEAVADEEGAAARKR